MRVYLPSNGLFGLKSVEFNIPKIKQLRDLSTASYTDEQATIEVVRMLLSNPEDLYKMSILDKEYLFKIAVESIHMGDVAADVECSECHKKFRISYRLSEQELFELPEGTPREVSKSVDGRTYTFHFLTPRDEEEIIDYALVDYDHYAKRYESAFVAKTLGFPATQDGVDAVGEYPHYAYYAALLFSNMSFHGVTPIMTSACPHCGQLHKVVIPFVKSILGVESTDVVNRFMQVSGIVDWQSFLDMSFPEYNQLVKNLDTMEG